MATIYTIAGDSLVAVDHFARALSVFDAEGRFSRTFRLAAPTRPGFGSQAVRGILEEGTAVVSAAQDFGVSSRATGYRRDPFLLLLYDPLGNVRTEIGQFPDLELTIEEGAGGPFARPVNMGRSTLVATMQDGVVVSTTDRFEIRRYGLDGTLELIIRVLEVPPAVDGAVRSAYIRHQLEQIDDDDLRARVRVNLERSVLPQYLPALGDLHTDDRGRVWVQEFVPPYDPRAPQWWIFDTAGDVVAVATLPTGFRPYRIADDHVLGVALDSLGVGHVQSRLIYR